MSPLPPYSHRGASVEGAGGRDGHLVVSGVLPGRAAALRAQQRPAVVRRHHHLPLLALGHGRLESHRYSYVRLHHRECRASSVLREMV